MVPPSSSGVTHYLYGESGSDNKRLARIQGLGDSVTSANYVTYQYCGLDRYVKVSYPVPGVNLSYISETGNSGDDAGDPYTGWDRFGRTQDLPWRKDSTTLPQAILSQAKYGYNRASQRTWCTDPLAPVAKPQDEAYTYDGLYQLTGFSRGELNTNHTAIGGIPVGEESFNYDPIGNWQATQTKADGSVVFDQTRTNTTTNEILTIDGSGMHVAYDAIGNMTLAPPIAGDWEAAYTLVWDAWNRLVKVKDGTTTIAEYAYDGLTRRITKIVGSLVTHLFYNSQWKIVEEREGTSTSPSRSSIWGIRYRDDLVRRTATFTPPGGGSPVTETAYALHDYYNVTAIVNTSGVVQERYGYSAFGETRFMAADYTPKTASTHAWDILYKAQQRDLETGFYNYGYRFYLPQLGRWPSRDPIGIKGGINLYAAVNNNGVNGTDYLGLVKLNNNETHDLLPKLDQSKLNNIDCGCYNITASFTKLSLSVTGEKYETNGVDASFSLSATKNTNKANCGCKCQKTKVIQFSRSETEDGKSIQAILLNWRRARTDEIRGWRVDAPKGNNTPPHVSDTPFGAAGGLGGRVSDQPGEYKHFQALRIRTCLVCDGGEESGKILGCLEWGYKSLEGSNGERDNSAIPPKINCANDADTQKDILGAAQIWNDSHETNQDKSQGRFLNISF